MKSPMIAFLLASMLWTSHGAQGADERATVEIVPKASGYQLLRNGQPYFICGVCGSSRLDELMAAGGNSIRTTAVRAVRWMRRDNAASPCYWASASASLDKDSITRIQNA